MALKRKLVGLVTTEIFTPYRANEIFFVPEETAKKLLKTDSTKTDFGRKYPKVKVRRLNMATDAENLLQSGALTLEEHNLLLKKLHPEAAPIEGLAGDFESEVTSLLGELRTEAEAEKTKTTAKATK